MPFAKHQTFHLREGWLFKGMAAIKAAEAEEKLPTIFLDKDAPERLGIGRNMVYALRFWMQATGLAEEMLEERRKIQRLTPFGNLIWEYDRYLESEATLWLIHYYLVCNDDQATTWHWFFNHFAPVTFEASSCLDALAQWVITTQNKKIAQSSLKKDVDCLLKTYVMDGEFSTPENLISSPLAQLNLLSQIKNGHQMRYRLERLNPNRLDPLILLYVLLDHQQKQRADLFQVNLSQVLREPMNAGRVFNLTTAVLSDLLAELNTQHPDWRVQFDRTAGLDQLTLPKASLEQVLIRYYREREGVVPEMTL